MKNIVFFCLFLQTITLYAQIIVKGIEPLGINHKKKAFHNNLPPLALPFWDDFSTTSDTVSFLWEKSQNVFVNKTLAVNPPTVGVATLDGLTANGSMYENENTYPKILEQLMSRPIDLSGYKNNKTVFLSFFFQKGGNGELPDNTDWLRLQLLNEDSVWTTIWRVYGNEVNNTNHFEQKIFNLDDQFLHKNFRLKFENFGNPQGPFDTWHLDYVFVDQNRSATNLTYLDRAFTGVFSSITHPYYEIPASHFYVNPSKYLKAQSFQASNLDTQPHTLDVLYTLKNTNDGTVYTISDLDQIFTNYGVKNFTISELPKIKAKIPPPDSIVFINQLSTNSNDSQSPINLRVNDTVRQIIHFTSHYSYDDGVAEFSAGIKQYGASFAVQYVINVEDTLTHIDILFPNISPKSEGKLIEAKVWLHLEKDPLTTENHTIQLKKRNEFNRIKLTSPIVISDTIYVGFTQKTNDFIGIGLDRNNYEANKKVFYKGEELWKLNEKVQGVLMIRPVFGKRDPLVLSHQSPNTETVVYPNPTGGIFTIKGDYDRIELWSLTGQCLLQEKKLDQYEISHFDKGMYILKIIKNNRLVKHKRLVLLK